MDNYNLILQEFNIRPVKVVLNRDFGTLQQPQIRRSERIREKNQEKNAVPAKRVGRSRSVWSDTPNNCKTSSPYQQQIQIAFFWHCSR